MIGTSGAMRVLWEADAVTIPRGLWCYRADGRRFVMGGALSSGGNVYAWARDTLRLGQNEEVEEKIAAMKADGHGLTVLPFLAGERSTGWVSDALAAIAGISMETAPVDILRACLEAVAFGLAGIYDLLVEEFGELREVIASGGALLRSPAWTQIISDVMGIRILTSAEGENSSRGAALMALEALGASASIDRGGTLTDRVYSPDPRNHISYEKARKRHQRLYESLIQGRWILADGD
jgi:gluconokinase